MGVLATSFVNACSSSELVDEAPEGGIGVIAQALDTDADGLDDAWETTHFGNLSQAAAGDFDADGMTNLEEYTGGFIPTVKDAFEDADGDRYPNIFELRNGTDPNSAASVPTPSIVVNGAGGGTHTNVSAAITTADGQANSYPIIAIAPGTYAGTSNLVTISSATKRYLFIGLQGADKTIIDGGGTSLGWRIQSSSVVASLTFQRTTSALTVLGTATIEARLVDLHVRDNIGVSYPGALNVSASASTVHVVGSTFLNNRSNYAPTGEQVYVGAGTTTLKNTVVWGDAMVNAALVKAASATLVTNHSLVKAQTLTGTGNLAGTTDPLLLANGHLRSASPLRSAGGSVAQSRVDMDGELRPTSTPDIGADQFVDSDADSLADSWELAYAGNLTTLTGAAQDADGDGLSNDAEYTHGNGPNPVVADTDGDGLSDGSEVNIHGSNPRATDTDGDEMPDGWEATHGLSLTTANAFEDADGDRYPNVFEYAYATNPADALSKPTPGFVVNAAGGGTHTNVAAAISAANAQAGTYKIVGLAPGVYTGNGTNTNVSLSSTKKLLLIGLEGAGKTVIEGDGTTQGWTVANAAVIASLAFRKTTVALYVSASSSSEVRLVDLLVSDNGPTAYVGGVYVNSAAKVHIVGSTFLNNRGSATADQIYIANGAASLVNTVVWGPTAGTMLAKAAAATLTTNYSLVKGQTLSGTGNLAGTTDPKLRADGRPLWNSPLRGTGGAVAQSRIDTDGELRPATPDIGFDQFIDTDADDLADKWELDRAGGLTALTSRSQDADTDGLTNEGEYANDTLPLVADTDGDGLSDGAEVNTHGTSPRKTDTDGDEMPDAWEVTYGISPTTANAFEDADGDRYPNVFEYAFATNPSNASSTPTPSIVVNGAGGGTHTTVGAAITAANGQPSAFPIIAIAPGVYTGAANVTVNLSAQPKKYLFIGLQGAGKTVLDGGATGSWAIQVSAVVSSLTFRNMNRALTTSGDVRLVDLVVRDNINTTTDAPAGVLVVAGSTQIIGSTFLDNDNPSGNNTSTSGRQIAASGGANVTLTNTVVWGRKSFPMVVPYVNGTVTTNYCLVKGQTLVGTGNLPGSVNPKLRADARIAWDSPLRGAGVNVAQSKRDMDGELRSGSAPDIGADQVIDADADGLPDAWEFATSNGLTALTGTGDADLDGLTDAEEYAFQTDPFNDDTDGDGWIDGSEVDAGLNPTLIDYEDWGVDHNDDGAIDAIDNQLGTLWSTDSDGDSVSNAAEVLMCTDPLRADSDGDGIPDSLDPFPLDPHVTSLPAIPGDVTPPVVTLTAPWFAVEQ